jgi:hypothetical protein
MSDQVIGKVPTIEELRRIYDEGVPQTLLSGVQVQMRPVRADKLLALGRIPDILTPIMLKSVYEVATEELDSFLFDKRETMAETLEMIRAVDAVCAAALVEPSLVEYLTLQDRMWIFKLAFMPAEVLSTFRLQSRGDVENLDDGEGEPLPTERAASDDAEPVRTQPANRVSV